MSVSSIRRPKVIHRISARGFPYEEISLENILGAKLGGPIPDACLHRAERALSALKDQYMEWVYRDLDLLEETLEGGLDDADPARRTDIVLQLRRLSHDMRGQGGTFGYPLVSQVAGALNEILKMPHLSADRLVRLIRLHADVIKRILDNRIEGEGGKAGPKIIERLNTLTEEVLFQEEA